MKKFPWILIFLFVFAALAKKAQNLHPVKDNIACLWGMKNDSGKWVIEPKYTSLQNTSNQFYLVMLNEKWGALNLEGKEIIQLVYDNLSPIIRYYSSQYEHSSSVSEIIAVKDGKTGLIDIGGKVKIPFQYDALWQNSGENFFHILLNKKTGIRTYEKEILPCQFTFLESIAGGQLFIVGNSDSYGSYDNTYTGKNFGMIKMDGDTIIPCRFDALIIPNSFSARPGEKTLIVAKTRDSISLYNYEGKCLLQPGYKLTPVMRLNQDGEPYYNYYNSKDENYYENKPLEFTEKGKLGIITPGKGLIQPAVFDSMFFEMPLSKRPGFYRVLQNGKWGLLNADGTAFLPCSFKRIKFYPGLIFVSEKENQFKEYDWRTKKLKPRTYQKILPFYSGVIDLLSGDDLYSNYNDTALHRCKVLASLPGDIVIIDPGYAIQGKGQEMERVKITGISINSSRYFSIQTKKGKLLCNRNYQIIIPPGAYKSFHDMDYSRNIVVITQAGKVGMIDTTGKLVVDTVFEAIGTAQANGVIFVKPWKPHDKFVSGHCIEGWALADTTGKLYTEAIFRIPGISKYETREFLITKEGIGLFDNYQHQFITPTNFLNGFFTGDGGCIMQSQDHLFFAFSSEGKALSPHGWKGLLHVAGDEEIRRYSPSYIRFNGRSIPDSSQLDDSWLLINGDSLALMNRGKLVLNRRKILDDLYTCFIDADALDEEDHNSPFYFHTQSKPFSGDCPRLNTGENFRYNDIFYLTVESNQDSLAVPKISEVKHINDSLVLRMVSRIAPKAHYPLHPNHDYGCRCFAANYEEGRVKFTEDKRRINPFPVSAYYRQVYRDKKIISLQILEDFYSSYYNSPIKKKYANRSKFENYFIGQDRWELLQLSQLFKPGYERSLNSEIVLAIQKADSLDMDCRNPGSYLQQCEGRFSFSEKGLWLYLEDNSGYEYVPVLIPWMRIKTIISEKSPAYVFLKK